MTETTIYLIRHGQTYFNRYNRMQGWSDSPLTEQGILDAQRVGKSLSQVAFNQAYCSDTGRARSTACLILKANQASQLTEPVETPFFREEFYGYFEGMNSPQAWFMTGASHGSRTYTDIINDYSIDASQDFMKAADPFHDAENSTEYWNRLLLGFDMVRRDNPTGATILLVSHGTTTRSIVGKFGQGKFDLSNSPRNGSVTKLLLDKSDIHVAYYNRIDNID